MIEQTHRKADHNGYIEIFDNPITKEGVYDYLGKEIGADVPDKIYKVYRPAEELEKKECLDSFKLVPFIDNHEYLGPESIGATPPEKKGIHGVIGEQVRFEKPYMLGNLKIFTESMKNAIDPKNEKRDIDLSAGYTCRYEFSPGVFNGEKYDAIQRDIRSNHLAKVAEGRTGKDVRILDHKTNQTLTFTCDTAEILSMADENEKEAVKTDITTALNKLKDMDASERDELLKELGVKIVAADEDTEDEATQAERDNESEAERLKREEEGLKEREDRERADRDRDRREAGDEDQTEDSDPAEDANCTAMDVAIAKRFKALDEKIKKLESRRTQDALVTATRKALEDRDAMIKKVKPFTGNFIADSMNNAADVALYAAGKLGIKGVTMDSAIAVIDGYLHDRKPDSQLPTLKAMDSKSSESVDVYDKYGVKK